MSSSVELSNYVEDIKSVDCVDRISRLPREVLGHVLSFLPTKDAVVTSILSKRWRYLFTLTNCLYFDDSPCLGDSEANEEANEARQVMFKNFVNKVLLFHQVARIEKFSLVCRGTYDESDLNTWVFVAVEKGVEDLQCEVAKQMGVLPYELFLCESLVRLKLIFYPDYELEVPSSARLTSLRILHLEYLMFPDDESMERLFSICGLLEELTLKSCTSETDQHAILRTNLLKVLTIEDCQFDYGSFEIDAPNLARLSYRKNTGVKIVPSWKDSSSFIWADLSFNRCRCENDCISLQYDRELIKAAAYKATTLCLFADSLKRLLTLADPEEMPNFHCLTRLHLHDFPCYAWNCLTSLLDKSPQLETVVFGTGLHHCLYDDPESLSNATLSPFSCNVKVIEVRSFCKHKASLLLLGHLLKNTGSLERLIVHKSCDIFMEKELQISKEDLLMLPSTSTDCCVELI